MNWTTAGYQCLHGNPEPCNYLNSQLFIEPVAEMADGTVVIQQGAIGGLSELHGGDGVVFTFG